jgi:hypothetical protein
MARMRRLEMAHRRNRHLKTQLGTDLGPMALFAR